MRHRVVLAVPGVAIMCGVAWPTDGVILASEVAGGLRQQEVVRAADRPHQNAQIFGALPRERLLFVM
jgi:hypothetical protein